MDGKLCDPPNMKLNDLTTINGRIITLNDPIIEHENSNLGWNGIQPVLSKYIYIYILRYLLILRVISWNPTYVEYGYIYLHGYELYYYPSIFGNIFDYQLYILTNYTGTA